MKRTIDCGTWVDHEGKDPVRVTLELDVEAVVKAMVLSARRSARKRSARLHGALVLKVSP